MSTHQFPAMGTSVEVHGSEHSGVQTQQVFERFEQRFSRFRSDSELSIINEAGGGNVSDDMRDLLDLSMGLRSKTDGLFDIGVGRAVRAWGYDRTFSDVVSLQTSPLCGHGEWRLEGSRVDLAEGTTLDLGGIAKGWTADRAVESGVAEVVSAGGDLRSTDPSLVVEIVDEDDRAVTEVHVGIGALATSSTRKRRWMVGTEEVHHLVDPRTMAPSGTPTHAATVVAETAAEAEAGAKAVLILGADGLVWADAQPWIRQAIVRWYDGSVYANAARTAS